MKNLVDALKEIISELQGKEGKKGAEKQPRISAISRPIPKEQEEQKTDQSISSEKERWRMPLVYFPEKKERAMSGKTYKEGIL